MKILKVPISKCDVWKDNPRAIMKEDFERLKKQIQKLGIYKPMIAYKEGSKYIVLGGNMRLRALRELNYKEIDISVVKPKSEAQKIEYSLSDNDRVGYYEEDKLAELIYSHKDEIDLKDYKVDLDFEAVDLENVIDRVSGEEVVEDEVPEPPKKAKTKTGDLYLLGEHKLLCGDATKKEDVEKLMNGKKADMVFTDPPYNIAYQGIKRKTKIIQSDQLDEEQYRNFLLNSFRFIIEPAYICCNWQSYPVMWQILKELAREIKSCIIWDKERRAQNLDKYAKRHEFIIYLGKLRGTTIRDDVYRLLREYSELHPTYKPVQLISDFILDSSKRSDIVLDLFGGSGSTLIACEQLNRVCYMMEIDPIYCDVIVQRWENFTGKKATLITNAKETKKNSLGQNKA